MPNDALKRVFVCSADNVIKSKCNIYTVVLVHFQCFVVFKVSIDDVLSFKKKNENLNTNVEGKSPTIYE